MCTQIKLVHWPVGHVHSVFIPWKSLHAKERLQTYHQLFAFWSHFSTMYYTLISTTRNFRCFLTWLSSKALSTHQISSTKEQNHLKVMYFSIVKTIRLTKLTQLLITQIINNLAIVKQDLPSIEKQWYLKPGVTFPRKSITSLHSLPRPLHHHYSPFNHQPLRTIWGWPKTKQYSTMDDAFHYHLFSNNIVFDRTIFISKVRAWPIHQFLL